MQNLQECKKFAEMLRKRSKMSKKLQHYIGIFASSDGDCLLQAQIPFCQDSATFFQKVAALPSLKPGTAVETRKTGKSIYNPLVFGSTVAKIKVLKIFNSNAKPLLIDMIGADLLGKKLPPCILKSGDDMRQDTACLFAFDFMNLIWNEHKIEYHGIQVRAFVYLCSAISSSVGMIQPVQHTIALSAFQPGMLNRNKDKDKHFLHRMVASTAGSFVAAYVLGVRDRHNDNILIRDDGTVLHIDFGYILGSKIFLDTSKFALTDSLRTEIGTHWEAFVELAVECFAALRKSHVTLIEFAVLVFAKCCQRFDEDTKTWIASPSSDEVRSYFRQSLFLDTQNDLDAENKFRQAVLKAPASLKTKLKNTVHGFATGLHKLKSRSQTNSEASSSANSSSIVLN
eukprot:TRINITY_DN25387_c0_g1_i2.p1 TRINITY_DN25387_c0_g1~~TRINITY_DN25387_c0_g1_i2.p1  ORF type:complete len:457 (-),score=126.03 TRINITY_DN25387_c0_g1_i2:35-1228(-)